MVIFHSYVSLPEGILLNILYFQAGIDYPMVLLEPMNIYELYNP